MTRIRYEVDDRVATVTIDRPEKRNHREGVAAFLERRPARFTGR